MATRGDVDHTHEPFTIADRKAEEFIEAGCGTTTEGLVQRMDSYACAGVKAIIDANNATRTS